MAAYHFEQTNYVRKHGATCWCPVLVRLPDRLLLRWVVWIQRQGIPCVPSWRHLPGGALPRCQCLSPRLHTASLIHGRPQATGSPFNTQLPVYHNYSHSAKNKLLTWLTSVDPFLRDTTCQTNSLHRIADELQFIFRIKSQKSGTGCHTFGRTRVTIETFNRFLRLATAAACIWFNLL